MRPPLPPLEEEVGGSERWENGNVLSAVISMTQRKAILMRISPQVLLLKTCLTLGFVRCVALQKICLKRLSGVAQKYGYISKTNFDRFNGHVRGYKHTELYVQHHSYCHII